MYICKKQKQIRTDNDKRYNATIHTKKNLKEEDENEIYELWIDTHSTTFTTIVVSYLLYEARINKDIKLYIVYVYVCIDERVRVPSLMDPLLRRGPSSLLLLEGIFNKVE